MHFSAFHSRKVNVSRHPGVLKFLHVATQTNTSASARLSGPRCSSHQRTVRLGGANVDVRVSRSASVPSHARSRFRADPRRVGCGGGLGRTNGAARVAAALAPAEAAPRARCLCSGDVRNSGEGPARPRRCAEACRLQGHALCARTHKQRGAGVAEFLSPRKLRCFRRNSAPLYCVCARVGHTPLVRQRCGSPVSKDTTIGWHRPAAHDS